jgi:fructuronate reductase
VTSPGLSRIQAAPPVRLVHLGLGNFFRAHQAWYTGCAPDASQWGFAAFAGRTGRLVADLAAQQGVYTLVVRGSEADRCEVISSLSRVHAADDHGAWLAYFAQSDVSAVTLTITEAGYVSRPEVQADLQALQRDPTALVRTAPARLVAGFAARRRADAGPIALVPCDNMAGNGAVAKRVVRDLAELLEPGLVEWIDSYVSIVTTAVDRITPRTTADDLDAVLAATGRVDRCPVVTEPFSEWVLSGAFPAGVPDWQAAGATFTEDVTPYERRKLWLLNGAHSLLAYAGLLRGHATVAEAISDDVCRGWVEQWWSEAAAHLDQPTDVIAAYRLALLDRFGNRRIRHQLSQIAADGSQKLPIRIFPVVRAERAAGRLPEGALRVLAAWISYLRTSPAPIADVRAAALVELAAGPLLVAVPRLLSDLDEALGSDADVVRAVADACSDLASG